MIRLKNNPFSMEIISFNNPNEANIYIYKTPFVSQIVKLTFRFMKIIPKTYQVSILITIDIGIENA